jgi:ATP-dependent protease Clp ATPase subunit
MFRRRRLACSFCGKGEADVAKLVAGPRVFICDQCVSAASQIMREDSSNTPPSPEYKTSLLRRVMKRIGRRDISGIQRFGECEAIAAKSL